MSKNHIKSGPVVVAWFRHGLRLHDNPSLLAAIDRINGSQGTKDLKLLPLFIFDGESAGTKVCGFNRFQFLLECLKDLDDQLKEFDHGKLTLVRGKPIDIFGKLHKTLGLDSVFFEQDCEPVWKTRDEGCKNWFKENNIHWEEKIGHTLWNPHEVLECNGGSPPLTFSMFKHVTSALGRPARPLVDPNFDQINFAEIEEEDLSQALDLFVDFPTPSDFGIRPIGTVARIYKGGERIALKQLAVRLRSEFKAFEKGSFLPNQRNPDILCPPKSLSPDLRFGSLSVRKFYWGIMDAFEKSQKRNKKPNKPLNPQIASQLEWREFFYIMSVNNDYYNEMERNEICINIPWYPHEGNEHWVAFLEGKTGFPFIDAGIRQLYKEGWIHHIVRNALAFFLTRGDLWISWEAGLNLFLEHLLDADWSVCAGNWMWVSSSAFEQVLNCSTCIDPCIYGRRADPWGEYVKRFLPELSKLPVEYLYEPWKAPKEVQEKAGCIIGKDYPERIVNHTEASRANLKKMQDLKQTLIRQVSQVPVHIAPSDEMEIRTFMAFPQTCAEHGEANCCGKANIES